MRIGNFVARSGLPSVIYSNYDTNFVGTSKLLLGILTPPPSAPHFRGLWKATVESLKKLLVRVKDIQGSALPPRIVPPESPNRGQNQYNYFNTIIKLQNDKS
ncbi:Uncharacterized protein FWK35_00006564 [Aphis craccivora]|uniref:Uncharacterized protein n=1 Tax=Aphis craccivora TaxID=307492 RepID=A0A6G0YTP0_APHCR|nr:Uncharacterized protein FWK35_00006564 [Aphis craccivora]